MPRVIESGKPMTNTESCGVRRLSNPSARFSASSSVTIGSPIFRPLLKMAPAACASSELLAAALIWTSRVLLPTSLTIWAYEDWMVAVSPLKMFLVCSSPSAAMLRVSPTPSALDAISNLSPPFGAPVMVTVMPPKL